MNGIQTFVFAALACGAAIATVLKFDAHKELSGRLNAEMQDVIDLIRKPHALSRYFSEDVYTKMGLDPRTRLMTYRFVNCGNVKTEKFLLKNLIFGPDPLEFPGKLTVSFSYDLLETIEDKLQADVVIEKRIGSSWIKLPCLGNIGSCHYDDLCTFLSQITTCPPEFVKAGISCNCPLQSGNYTLPSTSFEVDASFLPPGDYHIRANLTILQDDGGCYDIYASVDD